MCDQVYWISGARRGREHPYQIFVLKLKLCMKIAIFHSAGHKTYLFPNKLIFHGTKNFLQLFSNTLQSFKILFFSQLCVQIFKVRWHEKSKFETKDLCKAPVSTNFNIFSWNFYRLMIKVWTKFVQIFSVIGPKIADLHMCKIIWRKFSIFPKKHLFVIFSNTSSQNQILRLAIDAH